MARVLLVTNDFPPTLGGIQSYVRDYLAELPPQDVVVFASTQDSVAAESYDAALPYKVYRWPRKIMLPTSATARRMAEIIEKEHIDTVWFGAAAPLGLLGKKAKKAGARRVIASTHGHEVGWAMIPIARQLLRLIGQYSDVVTYISEFTLERIRGAFGPSARFAHLPSGVDIERFHPVENGVRERIRKDLGWDENEFIIACISRLVPRKGQDRLIQALPEILREEQSSRLVLVGGGPYENTLVELAEKHGVADHVAFMGRVSEECMVEILQACDLFAMPCRTRGRGLDVEGLGIVFLEAQACGVPVIAGNSGGAPETIASGSGVVVDGNNAEAVALAVNSLAAMGGERRQAMSDKGRKHVREQWSWEIMGRRLRALL
ncbi:glycosyltransferase family 4 protein [Corynebacterium pseudotuberculosis]|uniref:Glycosyltransferase n=1 Tax=Corynebacterium pseudotuberculosis (strain C231) TaxID=681645 RepID=D9QBG0_CORP2|nr:glycosyltransferase family 4 protein [Corynebacterium pseudotuberculosis]ADK29213.1 glycosyltransferase [Corynebacterium pseudotuberculosis FRC41]ADL10886.1 glycosyltransferase [Corynebacterium pseudotuberculosis C231]ADL21292.1 glycosyltransferase family 4 protein [Corynebacterium pseudotuberculosis 1002]ADO26685.1 glycosyltransferase [Corynebacterium pseudotuberculosis I19]AEK92747.1 Mannosyltransferase [Corynebacterium pseudotuberculosis PAT10]